MTVLKWKIQWNVDKQLVQRSCASIVSNMVIAQMIVKAAAALIATGRTIHHCASKPNYKTTPATAIWKQKKRWWLLLKKTAFAALFWSSMQMEFSVEPQWTLVLEVDKLQQLWLIALAQTGQKTKQTEMLLSHHQQSRGFLNVDTHKAQKDILVTVPNPGYKTLLQSCSHLTGVFIDSNDTKAE